jgi:hypothetical protein
MSIAKWEAMKICYFAQKRYVSPSDLDFIKEYEDGDVERVWCEHCGRWCSCLTDDPRDCAILRELIDE